MTTITIATAALHDALTERPCRQWDIVEQEWPDEIPLTEATIARARELDLDLAWVGGRLPEPVWAEYERAIAPAWAEYKRATAPACAEYERAIAPAWAEYERAIAPAWAENERVRDAALLDALIRLALGRTE